MDLPDRTDVRRVVQGRRRRPRPAVEISVPFDGGGKLEAEDGSGPLHLVVHATDEAGELAPWFDNEWWCEVIRRWAERAVTVRIAETPGALLHPVVLHSLSTLRRVVPSWRLVGCASVRACDTPAAIEAVATSPYHEVRFTGGGTDGGRFPSMPVEELFRRIREVQQRCRSNTPVLVRVPGGGDSTQHSSAQAPSRAVRV